MDGPDTKTRPVCYLVDPNATQAAIRAEDSIRTTQEQSARLLSNVMVSEHCEAAVNHWQRTGVTMEKVIAELVLIGFANMLDLEKGQHRAWRSV